MASFEHEAPGRVRRFHLAVWRWHFYAGVCVLPFTLVLAGSGLAMLASEPIDRHLQADLLKVTPQGKQWSPTTQALAVAAAYPDAEAVTFLPGSTADESSRIEVLPRHTSSDHGAHGTSEAVTVFVDPYTGTVLGALRAEDTVYAWAKKLHGTMLLGTTGDYIMEIAAGFGVLLIVTGLYLWWPRQRQTLRMALLPAVGKPTPRRWRDLHAAVGAWIAPLLLFFFMSGLAWTPFWGGELVQAWSSLPGEQFDAPLADATHASLDHGAQQQVPWAVGQTPLPASGSQRGTAGIATMALSVSIT